MYYIVILCLCVWSAHGATEGTEGDICLLPSGEEGVCTLVEECPRAVADDKFRDATKICGFSADDPIVCCARKNTSQYESLCDPITPRRPDMTFGKKAFEKCLEYQEAVVFPCAVEVLRRSPIDGSYTTHRQRAGGCYEPPPLIVGSDGIDASRGQFPHMALLGFGNESSAALWGCGATIISERFLLTAAHCTFHRQLGDVRFARLGLLKRSEPALSTRVYGVARAVTHPAYAYPSKYNDIALLQLDQRIVFVNKFVSPACLDVEGEAEYLTLATGWGAVGHRGQPADVLQIMLLTQFTSEECSEQFPPERLLERGVDADTQLCYGHRSRPTDTCEGDSGGPLQVELSGVECMHKVVGVTSFGSHCGRVARPAVYTRVRHYVPWIEEVVWPDTTVATSTVREDN